MRGLAGLLLKSAAVLVAFAFLLSILVSPARAQGYPQPYSQPSGLGGFMQGLFGHAPQVAPPVQPALPQATLPRFPQSIVPYRAQGPDQTAPASKKPLGGNSKNASATLGGGLRTMCVRTCDGYYWPMTFDARRNRLDHDAKACAASCANEARLFIMPNSGEAKDMVDQQGRPYAKLPNAFKYRKLPANSCTCKPNPWDGETQARHDAFAERAKSALVADASADATPSTEITTAEQKTATGTPDKKPLTLADAETLSLSGGLVEAGSGIAANIAAVGSPKSPAGPALASAGVGQDGGMPSSKPAKSIKASATSKRRENVPREQRLTDAAARTAQQRNRAIQTYGQVTPPIYIPGRGPISAGYPRQPYVIVQPQGMPYRAY